MTKDLPIYKITIDPEYSDGEDLGIEQIAFTSNPAIKVKGMAFSQEVKMLFADDLKYRVTAPAFAGLRPPSPSVAHGYQYPDLRLPSGRTRYSTL